jgi:hypothetical protein
LPYLYCKQYYLVELIFDISGVMDPHRKLFGDYLTEYEAISETVLARLSTYLGLKEEKMPRVDNLLALPL